MSRALLALALGAACAFALSQAAFSAPPRGVKSVRLAKMPAPAGYPVVHLRRGGTLRSRPGGRPVVRLGARTEFGSPQVLSVVRRHERWLGVVTAARPNGRLAWIRRDAPGLRLSRVRVSLHADLSARRVELRIGRRVSRRLRVAVGRPGSPTPTGRFAVTDRLEGGKFGPYYGCCILALSARQPNPPPGWKGGDRMAIHGTSSPGTVGTASSAGCLRAHDADLRLLIRHVPAGTPAFIRP